MAKKAKSKPATPKTNGAKHVPDPAHVAFLKAQIKEGGPCAGVRALAKKYSSLKRADVVAIARAAGVNPSTASTQYQQARTEE